MSSPVRLTLATAVAPGAIALLQLQGPGARDVLTRTIKSGDGRPGALTTSRVHLVNLADIDRGLAVVLRDDWVQIMPHGGLRVVEKLTEALVAAGAVYDEAPDPRSLYPEAQSDLEAEMLAAIARAASPVAIDLLLAQPRLWQDALQRNDHDWQDVLDRSRTLDRLIDPPTVVVVGQPNVGKSTLTNRMLGRSVSVVADLPGTTRDWVGGLAELQPSRGGGRSGGSSGNTSGGVAVRWLDTPGLRHSDDAIEQQAIELAGQVIATADVLVVMRDPDSDWPDPARLPRAADLRVINKIDTTARANGEADALPISARTGVGLDELSQRVLKALGLHDPQPTCWAFNDRLRQLATNRASTCA